MHSPGITIEDIELQIQKGIEDKVQIVMTLKNNSQSSTYYMLKQPRNIDYDQSSYTLSIGLFEKELLLDTKAGCRPFEPEQLAILPDSTLQWQYLVPMWMKKITRPSGLREVVQVVNIADVQKVVCTVAYHDRPFRVEPFDEEVLVALSRWGERVSASFGRTVR